METCQTVRATHEFGHVDHGRDVCLRCVRLAHVITHQGPQFVEVEARAEGQVPLPVEVPHADLTCASMRAQVSSPHHVNDRHATLAGVEPMSFCRPYFRSALNMSLTPGQRRARSCLSLPTGAVNQGLRRTEVTRVILVPQDAVVVLTTSVTASSRVLPVLADTAMAHALMPPLLARLVESGRLQQHHRPVSARGRRDEKWEAAGRGSKGSPPLQAPAGQLLCEGALAVSSSSPRPRVVPWLRAPTGLRNDAFARVLGRRYPERARVGGGGGGERAQRGRALVQLRVR